MMYPIAPRSFIACLAAGVAIAAGTVLAAPAEQASAPGGEPKVLRLAFSVAETTFDPAKIVDLYSRTITPHIFEGLYTYDHLARPAKIKPLTAAGMPEVSADFRTWTVKVRPGIYYASDPAFKGQRRELMAADYAYQLKRVVDPANKSPVVAGVLETKFIGLAALRDDSLKNTKPFDYDKPIEAAEMVGQLDARVRAEGLTNVRCERADLYDLPYEPGRFDAVFAANVLHLVPDLERALAALRRVLAPGGILVTPTYLHAETFGARVLSRVFALTGFPGHRRFTSASLLAALASAGLAVQRTETIPGPFPIGYVEARA